VKPAKLENHTALVFLEYTDRAKQDRQHGEQDN
jgi:hypothetical protein